MLTFCALGALSTINGDTTMKRIPNTARGLALSALTLLSAHCPGAETKIPDEYRVGGFILGCQAYTFNRFTVFEAIEKTGQAGGKTIEFYTRQKLSKDKPSVTFNHDSPADVIAEVKTKLDEHKIRAVNYGVVGGKDEAEWRKIFEFARKMGLYAITTEDVKNLDVIEKLVKEYDIKVGIHEHARKQNDPNYKVWDPNYVLSVVKDRDKRIGACADTGHWMTSGLKPVDCLKILKGRIISSHLKDKTEFGPKGHDVPYGTGSGSIRDVLDELKHQGFDGNISIEYEYNWDNSVTDVAQCIGFVRGYAAGKK